MKRGRSKPTSSLAQKPKISTVVYQGIDGSFSGLAAKAYFARQQIQLRGTKTFRDLLTLVHGGEAEFGVVPFENSVIGSINQVLDGLVTVSDEVNIVGEFVAEEVLCLAVQPTIERLEQIQIIESDFFHMEQAQSFLIARGCDCQQRIGWDSSASAKSIAEAKDDRVAVIASKEACEANGLKILHEVTVDDAHIVTRYVIVSKRRGPPIEDRLFVGDNWKCTMVWVLENKTAAAFKALSVLSLRDLSLSRIESRPACTAKDMFTSKAFYFDHVFHVEVTGQRYQLAVLQKAINSLEDFVVSVRVLGLYQMHTEESKPIVLAGLFL